MAKSWTQTILALLVVGVGLVVALVVGLFAYVSFTATPLHPDPQRVPSEARRAESGRWADAISRAEQAARADLAGQNLPGLSVAVGVGGDLAWAEGFGYADLETKAHVTPGTRFRAGTASVPFTSAAAGLLLEQNRLKLDDEIQTYVPEYPKKPWPVTLRQVMGNTAGIGQDQGDEESLARCERTLDALPRFASRSLRFEPGTEFRSSSYGWILVSAAIEAASGEPFLTVMRTQVFEPLAMVDTIPDDVREAIPDRATFYFPRFGGDTRYGPEAAREGDHSCFAGAGAFLSTPSDMVRFGLAMDRAALLQPATVTTLQTSQRLRSGTATDYGLGWSLETVTLGGQPARMAGHGTKRDFIGGAASLLTFPERGIVVAVMSNTSFADTKAIGLKVAEAFAAQGMRPAGQ